MKVADWQNSWQDTVFAGLGFFEVLHHDECIPGSARSRLLVLTSKGRRIDSIVLGSGDSVGGDWSEKRQATWQLDRIDGVCVKGWLEDLLGDLDKEIERRRAKLGVGSYEAMHTDERDRRFLTALLGRARNMSFAVRTWRSPEVIVETRSKRLLDGDKLERCPE